MSKLFLVLEDIRSIYNVGAIFRTADATAVDMIYLCGHTPGPLDRFGRPVAALHKTALGAEQTVPYQQLSSAAAVVRALKADGVKAYAIEQTANATDLVSAKFFADQAVAFVLGSEVPGVSTAVLAEVDQVLAIPMWGTKESLNVSVAAGVVLYQFRTHIPPA